MIALRLVTILTGFTTLTASIPFGYCMIVLSVCPCQAIPPLENVITQNAQNERHKDHVQASWRVTFMMPDLFR